MTRNEAREIVYALRDWLNARDDRFVSGSPSVDEVTKARDRLVEALVEASNDREGAED